MKYILMLNPEESNNFSIDYNFIEKLLQDFDYNKFEVEEIKHDESIYSHIFSFEKGCFELYLNRDKNSISLEGDWKKTIGFIILFISHLPNNQKVHFFDDSYNDNMIVDSNTTKKDIESVFTY